MGIRFKKCITSLPEYIAGKTIEEIKKEYNLKEVYKLASNENIMGPSPEVKKVLDNAMEMVNYYPDNDASLIRKCITEKYGIMTDNIILGCGTNQLIEMICDSFIGIGDNIVTADPNFLLYGKYTLKCEGEVIKVPLKDYRQDILSITVAVNAGTRLIFLASPFNPTGAIITKEELKAVLEAVPEDVLIVMDEAYHEYVPEEELADTISIAISRENLIVLRTFSKAYGLAGLRVGFGVASAQVIAGLNKIRLPFNVSSVAQKAAAAALGDDEYIRKVRKEVLNEKKIFYSVLEKAGIDYLKSYANFIAVKVGPNEDRIVEALLKEGYIVRQGKNLGIPDYIRITVSIPEINKKFLDKFISIYKSLE